MRTLQRELAEIDACLLQEMQPYAWAHALLRTIPAIADYRLAGSLDGTSTCSTAAGPS